MKKGEIDLRVLSLLLAIFALLVILLIFRGLYSAKDVSSTLPFSCPKGQYSIIDKQGNFGECQKCPENIKCNFYKSKEQCSQDNCNLGCNYEKNACVNII